MEGVLFNIQKIRILIKDFPNQCPSCNLKAYKKFVDTKTHSIFASAWISYF